MPYRAIFPLEKTDDNKHAVYDIAVSCDGMGVLFPHFWHAPILVETLEEGTKIARKVLNAMKKRLKCPCNQELCRLKEIPKYVVEWAPEPKKKKEG